VSVARSLSIFLGITRVRALSPCCCLPSVSNTSTQGLPIKHNTIKTFPAPPSLRPFYAAHRPTLLRACRAWCIDPVVCRAHRMRRNKPLLHDMSLMLGGCDCASRPSTGYDGLRMSPAASWCVCTPLSPLPAPLPPSTSCPASSCMTLALACPICLVPLCWGSCLC
jgi:hypothetical protein